MDILKYKIWDIKKVSRDDIPKTKGLYAYLDIHDKSLKYIGSAVGNNGLRGRIWNQHLNPIYLESRKNKFTAKDKNQLSKRVLRNNKLVIEKSAFRKNIARKYDLTPGESCLKFLKDNFLLIFIPLIDYDEKKILSIEKHLILKEKPDFNIKNG